MHVIRKPSIRFYYTPTCIVYGTINRGQAIFVLTPIWSSKSLKAFLLREAFLQVRQRVTYASSPQNSPLTRVPRGGVLRCKHRSKRDIRSLLNSCGTNKQKCVDTASYVRPEPSRKGQIKGQEKTAAVSQRVALASPKCWTAYPERATRAYKRRRRNNSMKRTLRSVVQYGSILVLTASSTGRTGRCLPLYRRQRPSPDNESIMLYSCYDSTFHASLVFTGMGATGACLPYRSNVEAINLTIITQILLKIFPKVFSYCCASSAFIVPSITHLCRCIFPSFNTVVPIYVLKSWYTNKPSIVISCPMNTVILAKIKNDYR